MKVKPLGRPAMDIGFEVFAGVIRSIEEVRIHVDEKEHDENGDHSKGAGTGRIAQGLSRKKTECKRSVCISNGKARMTVGVRHQRVKLSVGDEVIVAHYTADGFLPKLAGIHNCSSGAWYLMRQADEYLEGWLHIYRIQTWHYVAIFATLLAALATLIVHPIAGSCLLMTIIVALMVTVRKLKKSKLMLSCVACKSLAVQLMVEFKDLADTEDGTTSMRRN